jgi:hypothetical protein
MDASSRRSSEMKLERPTSSSGLKWANDDDDDDDDQDNTSLTTTYCEFE